MKKFWFILCACMLSLSVAACTTPKDKIPSGTDIPDDTTTPTVQSETEIVTEPTEEHEHNFVKFIRTEAKCEEDGKIIYRCSCGETKEEILPKLNHNFVFIEKINPTCKTEGEIIYRCRCNIENRELLEKVNHIYKLVEQIDAKCGVDGKQTYRCRC